MYHDSNASTQFRLFGNVSEACNADQIEIKWNNDNDASALNAPFKRSSGLANIATQNNSQITFNNLFHNETDRSRSIPRVNAVSTGLRLSYDEEEQHSSVTIPGGSFSSLPFSTVGLDNVLPEIEHQIEEFDRYVRSQGEQLTKGFKEMKHRQAASFMNVVVHDLTRHLRSKELEIDSMNKENCELADQIRQATAEAMLWQQRAHYNESVVHALQTRLHEAMAQSAAAIAAAYQDREGCGESIVDDAASSFYPNFVRDGEKLALTVPCKVCRGRESCMLFLPCRHLCMCKDCDPTVNACPTCFTRKTASVEVYIS